MQLQKPNRAFDGFHTHDIQYAYQCQDNEMAFGCQLMDGRFCLVTWNPPTLNFVIQRFTEHIPLFYFQ